MTTWFASDVHLDQSRPDITTAFIEFLRGRVAGAQQLFVLGDLFETWVGDDDGDDAKDAVKSELAALVKNQTRVFFIHGNRDFLVGQEFARATGVTLLDETFVADFYGTKVLLMHGDSLCTDDTQYQQFRAMVRQPQWQQTVLALPLEQRRQMARAARDASKAGMAHKTADIMDVNQNAVIEVMEKHNVTQLIHGHTHRPATHVFEHQGRNHTRCVLGDWYDQGRVIFWDESGRQDVTLAAHAPAGA